MKKIHFYLLFQIKSISLQTEFGSLLLQAEIKRESGERPEQYPLL